jgi:hypothetical protein
LPNVHAEQQQSGRAPQQTSITSSPAAATAVGGDSTGTFDWRKRRKRHFPEGFVDVTEPGLEPLALGAKLLTEFYELIDPNSSHVSGLE